MDPSVDRFEFIGEGIADVAGVSADDVTPERLESLIIETTGLGADQSGANSWSDERRHGRRDIRILTPSGAERWLSDAFVVFENDGQPATARIGILQDITERKQREALLIASEARAMQLADVVECTKNPVVIADADRRVTWVNQAFQSSLGRSISEVVGRRLLEIIEVVGSDVGESVQSLVSILDAGEAASSEIKIRTDHGDERSFAIEYQPRFDQSGQIARWILVANDVTELRRAQELLSEREEQARRLAMVVAHTDNGVILTGVDRRIEWVNAGFSRISGYSLEEVRGRVPGHFLQSPETDVAAVQKIRDELVARNGFRAELRNRRKDGRLYWVAVECMPMFDGTGELSGYMAIESDITTRVESETKLRQISAELETVLRLSPDGFALFDGAGRLTYCNQAFEQMLEVAPAQLHESTCEDIDRLLASACDSSTPPAPMLQLVTGAHERLLLKKPERMVVSRRVIRAADASDTSGARVLFLQDVTRDEELQQMKSDFLATAAHELRTPMTSIQGFAELLLADSLDGETMRDLAETIHRQSTSLVRMVNQLLDLQRIEQRKGRELERVEQPLLPIIRETAEQLKVAGDSRSTDLSGLVDSSVRVAVDSDLLAQALSNVLANSFKYSPAGGEISIALGERVADGAGQVGIRIQDHGIGMTPAEQTRIRERFYRANRVEGITGTGLGMAIVDEIMRLHSGSVEIESELGVGTTVTLWLPVAGALP